VGGYSGGMGDETRAKTGMTTIGGQIVLSDKLAQFRRLYRWLNLTLIHQAIWPLLLLLTAAPDKEPGTIPSPWFWARLAAPAAAAGMALLYLRHQPNADERFAMPGLGAKSGGVRPGIIAQLKVAIFALTIMLAAARVVSGPAAPALKLIAFGAADVLAFQLINFEVVRRSYRDPAQGLGYAIVLFGFSWALRDLLMVLLGPSEASPALAFLSGLVLGLLMGAGIRVLRGWLGGFWIAAAAQFLLVYLIIGFTG
jgi:hypothetical protein